MKTAQFQSLFWEIFDEAKASPIGQTMAKTVEASPWHREANVWVHTEMCVNFYYQNVMPKVDRTAKQQFITMLALLFHDFGKPEAEETLEKKDGTGTYRRYAGHEPKSANEMISFLCERPHIIEKLVKAGVGLIDIRKIKVMIEHHLPYGMTNKNKRAALKVMLEATFGDDIECFYDMLWSDCNGRISDDHETKRQNVLDWIEGFKMERQMDFPKRRVVAEDAPILYVLVGASGSGKSTWTSKVGPAAVVSLDAYRRMVFESFAAEDKRAEFAAMSEKDKYNAVFKFAIENEKDFDRYVDAMYKMALDLGKDIALDNTNTTRKSRAKWINMAKDVGYRIVAIEFYNAEKTLHARQSSRPDKAVPGHAVHRQFMSTESTWLGVEVDSVSIQY